MGLRKIKYGVFLLLCFSCKHKPTTFTGGDYPQQVANILLSKCAVAGCHNNISYEGAGGLNLSSWNKLFEGAGTGSVVIPYRPDFSSLCYFVNTDSALGIMLQPTMPINQQPLSREEYFILRDWIAAGAPDVNGRIRFAEGNDRRKIYVANRLCDVVTVIDADSRLQMRYVNVGLNSSGEFPYCVKVAPDKKSWYVSFYTQSSVVQQFSAVDDHLVANIPLGLGSWTSFAITSDSRYGYFVDNSNPGKVVYADLEAKKVLATYTFNDKFYYPSGIVLNERLKKLYIGCTQGNFIYSIDITDPLSPVIRQVVIDGTGKVNNQSSVDPGEMIIDPEGYRCYIACKRSGDIRVVDMQTDSVVHKTDLGTSPAFMTIAADKLFVSCPDDRKTFSGNRGSVAVIDRGQYRIIERINTGYQPYGLAGDKQYGVVAVVNANISSEGPDSHHVSGCGEKNGNVTFIDLETMKLLPGKKLEVAVYPFGTDIR